MNPFKTKNFSEPELQKGINNYRKWSRFLGWFYIIAFTISLFVGILYAIALFAIFSGTLLFDSIIPLIFSSSVSFVFLIPFLFIGINQITMFH